MRFSDWRTRAPTKESLGPKVIAVLEPIFELLGAREDAPCWIVWGEDPATRFLVFTISDAGLIQANARPTAGMRRNTTRRSAPGEALWVYQRTGLPCRRCGAAIRSALPGVDARRVYWCPACQPAPSGG